MAGGREGEAEGKRDTLGETLLERAHISSSDLILVDAPVCLGQQAGGRRVVGSIGSMSEAAEGIERHQQAHLNVVFKVFGYLGVCHFEHAAKLCGTLLPPSPARCSPARLSDMKKHVINSAFAFLHWRGSRNESFCDMLQRVIGAERELVRIVELNGQQRQELFLTFQGV
eukprot:765509-Hanusia_phi.AAC.5